MNSSRLQAQRKNIQTSQFNEQVRGPTTSINSAQAFNNSNTSIGKLAGQQAQLAQQKYLSQSPQSSSKPSSQSSISLNTTKMTIAQAITLITLRLGKVETLLNHLHDDDDDDDDACDYADNNSNMAIIDKDVILNINGRLDNLEKNNNNSIQFELLKNTVDNIKTNLLVVTKNQTDFKNELLIFHNEVNTLKYLFDTFKYDNNANTNIILDPKENDVSETIVSIENGCDPEIDLSLLNNEPTEKNELETPETLVNVVNCDELTANNIKPKKKTKNSVKSMALKL